MKYILVTGGVISGIGKGIVTSSIGALLKAKNLRITAIKIDPYLNIDAGTFSPYEHGEVYVLNDGCEVDLDLGNYERFLDVTLKHTNNITTGKINQLVSNRERQGDYLGKTVQIIPHVTDAIQEWIKKTAKECVNSKEPEVCIIELGGTIGDIESMPFVEALRQLQRQVKRDNFCVCHVSLVPTIGLSRELKSKPTQESVSKLRALGLSPDMIVCRSETHITDIIRDKISMFCGVEPENIFSLPDLETIYKVPIELHNQGIIKSVIDCLKIPEASTSNGLSKWSKISEIAINAKEEIIIALVGKYTSLTDCYASVVRSLQHSCYEMGAKPLIRFIDSSALEEQDNQAWKDLKSAHCLIVPGGFGIRGIEGKIEAIKWARENKIPFLGICLGFQMAAIEYARNVLLIPNAHSEEFLSDIDGEIKPIVIEMLEYLDPEKKMGGTMRLGLRKTKFVVKDSILRKLYGDLDVVQERHRHRYEINPDFIAPLEDKGLRFVGRNEDETRMEILELDSSLNHPYFVAVQYHPEYLSRPFRPSPPYVGLVRAAKKIKDQFL